LGLRADLEETRGEDYLLNDVVNAIYTKLLTFWDHIDKTSHIAAFLDPRYKHFCFPEKSIEEILNPICQILPISLQNESGNNSINTSYFARRLTAHSDQNLQTQDQVMNYWISAKCADNILPLL